MRPLVANFYLTYRCNDACEFCGTWADGSLQGMPEIELPEIKKILDSLKELGIAHVDFTGGEPLLRDDIADILKEAKGRDFFTTLTTNTLLYPEKAQEISPWLDRLIFSLDSPLPDEHDRIRGVASYDSVIRSIPIAKSAGNPPTINFTITRDTIRYLPEMVDLVSTHDVLLWINPVFDWGGLEGLDPDTIDHVKYFMSNKNVSMNLAALEFMKAFGNNTARPRCRAAHATITVTPDGSLMLPCIKNKDGKIRIEGSLKKTIDASRELVKMTGRMPVCSGCMMWPYMIPSFLYKIDRYFFLNLWSLFDLYRKEYRLKKGEKK